MTVHTLVNVLKGSNCLTKLGCLPKAFPEIGRFYKDDGMMSTNQPAAGPPVTDSRCDYTPIPMSQSIPLWVPVRGKSEGRQGPPTTAVRQAVGDSDLPCLCPRRQFREPPESLPMPATVSNRGHWRHISRIGIPQVHSMSARSSQNQTQPQCASQNQHQFPYTSGRKSKLVWMQKWLRESWSECQWAHRTHGAQGW